MDRIFKWVAAEFSKKPRNSILQLSLAGAVVYLISVTAGPAYGCGPGNSQIMEGMFSCVRGEMDAGFKILIVAGIVLASLCWGRAASLYEKRQARDAE